MPPRAQTIWLRDHFHVYDWRLPLVWGDDGNVRWTCGLCGHITKRRAGVIPASDSD
jgi:hypothetical protein